MSGAFGDSWKAFGSREIEGDRPLLQTISDAEQGDIRKSVETVLKAECRKWQMNQWRFSQFLHGYVHHIPIFSSWVQFVGFCEQEPNWRVLQASAHTDVSDILLSRITEITPLHQVDTKPCRVFD